MQFRRRVTLAAAAVFILSLGGCNLAVQQNAREGVVAASPMNASQGPSANDSRPSFYNVSVGPVNTDLLETGSVRLASARKFRISLRDAFPLVTYDVAFCPFATGETSCLPLGQIASGFGGVGDAVFEFPQRGVFAGIFTFSRDGQIQYMTGMTKPGRGDFFINQGLEPVAAVTGALGPGFVSGTDRLGQGSVEIAFSGITETFEIATSLKHAQPSATYSVLFCHFPSGSSDCSFITQVGTDVHGNSTMTTPLPRGDYYGVFVFTRIAGGQEQAEFVTAFRVR